MSNNKTVAGRFKIIFFAILIQTVIFAGVVIILVNNRIVETNASIDPIILQSIGGALLIGSFFLNNLLTKMQLTKIKALPNLKEKMKVYRGFIIMRYAVSEMPIMANLAFYLISADIICISLALIGLLSYLRFYPTHQLIINELDISTADEIEKLTDTPS